VERRRCWLAVGFNITRWLKALGLPTISLQSLSEGMPRRNGCPRAEAAFFAIVGANAGRATGTSPFGTGQVHFNELPPQRHTRQSGRRTVSVARKQAIASRIGTSPYAGLGSASREASIRSATRTHRPAAIAGSGESMRCPAGPTHQGWRFSFLGIRVEVGFAYRVPQPDVHLGETALLRRLSQVPVPRQARSIASSSESKYAKKSGNWLRPSWCGAGGVGPAHDRS